MNAQFVSIGTLPKPGLIGRLIRLGLGAAILISLVPGLIQAFPFLSTSTEPLTHIGLWVAIVLGVLNVNYVVNLGLSHDWGRRPQIVLTALIVAAVIVDLFIYSSLWAPPLGLLVFVWLLLEFVPLGVAFVLAAALGTPGCEMRSYNHLAARLTGQNPTEHFCPGGVDFADKW